jgi:raffinose/stachyose/melibiose transport system permease protein
LRPTESSIEYQVFWLVLPLVRPVIATIAVFVMVPVWNDLWFPLILAPAENARTVTLGTQQVIGSFATNWQAVLASLTLALVPPLVFYSIFSRQLLRGLTAGAIRYSLLELAVSVRSPWAGTRFGRS